MLRESTFRTQIASHTLEIVSKGPGPVLVLRCRKPDDIHLWFDIVVWPKHLTIASDHGCFTFRHWSIDDMLTFFRDGRQADEEYRVNLDYWSEKLVSDDTRFSFKEYDEGTAAEHLGDWLDEHSLSHDDDQRILEAFMEHVLDAESEEAAHVLIASFDWSEYGLSEPDGQWGWDLRCYSDHFIWCCFAIVWAIREYDRRT